MLLLSNTVQRTIRVRCAVIRWGTQVSSDKLRRCARCTGSAQRLLFAAALTSDPQRLKPDTARMSNDELAAMRARRLRC
jgi:hypothetical protein